MNPMTLRNDWNSLWSDRNKNKRLGGRDHSTITKMIDNAKYTLQQHTGNQRDNSCNFDQRTNRNPKLAPEGY